MPYYDMLPPWLRVVGRGLRLAGYACLLFVAAGDLLATPAVFVASDARVYVWSIPLAALSIVAFVAVAFHQWRWEWTTAWWLAAVVAMRAVAVWTSPGPPPPLSDGGLVTFVVTALMLRGLDLSVFAIRTGAWKLRVRRL